MSLCVGYIKQKNFLASYCLTNYFVAKEVIPLTGVTPRTMSFYQVKKLL